MHDEQNDKFEALGVIGAGGFGEVSLVRERLTGALFALKQVRGGGELEGLQRYRNAVRSHPHLVQLYEIGATPVMFSIII